MDTQFKIVADPGRGGTKRFITAATAPHLLALTQSIVAQQADAATLHIKPMGSNFGTLEVSQEGFYAGRIAIRFQSPSGTAYNHDWSRCASLRIEVETGISGEKNWFRTVSAAKPERFTEVLQEAMVESRRWREHARREQAIKSSTDEKAALFFEGIPPMTSQSGSSVRQGGNLGPFFVIAKYRPSDCVDLELNGLSPDDAQRILWALARWAEGDTQGDNFEVEQPNKEGAA